MSQKRQGHEVHAKHPLLPKIYYLDEKRALKKTKGHFIHDKRKDDKYMPRSINIHKFGSKQEISKLWP